MSGTTKLLTAGGGGVSLTPASSIASDVTVNVPSVNGDVVLTNIAGTVALAATGANIITASTNGSERMRIDASGNLLVGTTSAPQSADGLSVKGKTTATGNQWNFQVWTNGGNLTFGCRDDYYVRSPSIYDRTAGSAANVTIDGSGYLYRSTSSIRYKTDVINYDRGIDAANLLRPVYYKSSTPDASGNISNIRYAGFIAEEVAEAGLDEFVVFNGDERPEAIHYGNMVAICIKAIQELSAKNDALEARIAALEAK
jgi:hypothetical protein